MDNTLEVVSSQILECSKLVTGETLPVFYKYRYTFPKKCTDIEEQKLIAKDIIKKINEYVCDKRITAGIEYYTKGMMVTNPHLHVHFVSKISSDTIRKALSRLECSTMIFDYPLFTGRCQSCKAEVLVDEDKFFRYPLKQQSGETRKFALAVGYTNEVAKEMINIAYACWKQSAEVTIGKLEKKLERSSYDRLEQYLDGFVFATPNDVLITALQYFAENEPCFCGTTIKGYSDKYSLLKHIISYSEYADILNKRN